MGHSPIILPTMVGDFHGANIFEISPRDDALTGNSSR